ncbi:MAG TPA: MarR family winged helix-turn-helix transcriptional regulator [Rhodopila sp.]|nr:MarR family winged helix-turn-helix transcriptional regulator [Rhodopila sp.]
MKKAIHADEGSGAHAFRLEDFLPYRLSVAAESVTHLIARHHLIHTDLAMPELRLLAAVGRYGVLSPTAAGERTSMDKVKVSRAAAGLVGRGLLRQTHDPDDGRGRLLRLTRKGTTTFAGIGPMAQAIEASLAPSLTKAEWAALQKALGKLSLHVQSILAEGAEDDAA